MVNFHDVLPLGEQKCFVWWLQKAQMPTFVAERLSPSLAPYLSISAHRQLIHEPPFL